MASTLVGALRDEVAALLAPLTLAETPRGFLALLQSLGHGRALADDAPLKAALLDCAAAADFAALDEDALSSWHGALQALQATEAIFAAVGGVEAAIADPALASEATGLGQQLLTLLVSIHLRRRHPRLHRTLAALTLIHPAELATPSPIVVANGQLIREPWRVDTFHLERLETLLRDPWPLLGDAYFPNGLATVQDAAVTAARLFPISDMLVRALGLTSSGDLFSLEPPPVTADSWEMEDHFADKTQASDEPVLVDASAADPMPFLLSHKPRQIIRLAGTDSTARLVLGLVISSADQPDAVVGVTAQLVGSTNWSEVRAGWQVEAATTGEIPVFVFGPGGLRLASATAAGAMGRLSLTKESGGQPAFQLGDPNGSRLEVADLGTELEFDLSPTNGALIGFGVAAKRAHLVLDAEGDGFLGEVLPSGGLKVEFDVSLALWSNGALDLALSIGGGPPSGAIPLGMTLGPLLVQSITREFSPVHTDAGSGLTVAIGADLVFRLGPVTASLEGPSIGADLLWTLSDHSRSKNLGLLHVDRLGLRPPRGVGLSVDAAGLVSGGGSLFHDEAAGLYAGELQLSIEDRLTVKAFGLITTGRADGGPKFSLVVFITVEDFVPIQLGFGFRLTGIGGMLAVHRTFDQDAIRAGLKSDNLKSLLFPQNPATNAPTVIQALAAAFPPKQGAYLLGLLVQLGWPTPTLVEMDLALILEFGDRNRLLVLGRISSLLPSRDNDLIRLNLDAMGVLDFDQGTVAIDAVLVDSRLAHRFPLTGAMALRARLKSGPGSSFVMAIGGLNQRFAPPEGLPELPRITIALCSGDNPRLTCEAYFAITANTVQYGARAQLYAAAYGFSIQGDIGYDVLVELVPIHFIADFHASLQLKHGTTNLFKVTVDGELEGPRPLKASGKASFEIFWCDFTISFDKTLVEGDPPPPPPAVDITAELKQALLASDSWSSEAGGHGVALRGAPIQGAAALDPASRLVLRQRVVPLNTARDIELFGGAPVTAPRRFQLSVSLAGQDQHANPVQEQFAPAQFFAMNDDEKLAAPSFETMEAGLMFGDAVAFDAAQSVAAPLECETFTLDDEAAPPAPDQPLHHVSVDRLALFARSGAAGRAAMRRTGRRRFANTDAPPAVAVQPLNWVVTPLGAGPAAPPETAKTWSELQGAVRQLNRGGSLWQLAPAHELAA